MKTEGGMERVRQLQTHPQYLALYDALQEAERDRIFCRHTMEHFLAVARLMWIYNLEDNAGISKDVVYAAALLHDLGRYAQLETGKPHEVAGAEIAGEIMQACGFKADEIRAVQSAILSHRTAKKNAGSSLPAYLYRADKQSRNCFLCSARSQCNWPEEKKNLWIQY